ncbi:MAG: transglutaminase family protein [Asgard group archaeon]|nr:transglutaminase family protein [Asgard group archaeon]
MISLTIRDRYAMNNDAYLKPTFFIDSDSEKIRALANNLKSSSNSEKDLAIQTFRFVRDNFPYTIKDFQIDNPSGFKASSTLEAQRGFCIPKSILLVALLRANDIPARLHFADIINHRSPQHFRDLMGGSNVFIFHGYAEVFLDKWYKLTPSFESSLCIKHDFPLCDFTGSNDAIFKSYDLKGRQFVDYIKDRGVYADLPFDDMVKAFLEFYGPLLS